MRQILSFLEFLFCWLYVSFYFYNKVRFILHDKGLLSF